MRLADLKTGDVVVIKLAHWHHVEIAAVIGRGRATCSLHGDHIDTTIKFQKRKGINLRSSYSYEIEEHGAEPEILEMADDATRVAVVAHT